LAHEICGCEDFNAAITQGTQRFNNITPNKARPFV